ncbi:MAG: response regulator [Anaerolineae bacterium]
MAVTGAAVNISSEHVREELEHPQQNSYLAAAPLGEQLPEVAAVKDGRQRAQLLRRILLDAIELLQPARPEPFGSHNARSYEVLTLRYIEGMDAEEIAQELGVSERQVYRDLRRAQDELARLLSPGIAGLTPTRAPGAATEVHSGAPASPTAPAEPISLAEEMERLVTRPKRLDLAQVLGSAVQSIEPLAARFGVTVEPRLAPTLPSVSADEGLLRQALIQALSLAVQSAPRMVRVSAEPAEAEVRVALKLHTGGQPLSESLLASLQLLADLQHLRLEVDSRRAESVISLALKVAEPRTVLVIEDNEGAIELYRRYLAQSEEWQVAGASDPRISLDMATRLQPAAIILDIMMPRQDGWSLLQALRATPATATIPVIVCSFFADPELASALGANVYLRKPVSRVQLLKALRECLPG